MKKQTLIQEPKEGESIRSRRRVLENETLETKPIMDIVISRQGYGKDDEYLVRVDDGTTHRMKKVGQNPRYLVFYNDQPLATCGINYVPLFNSEIENCVLKALEEIGRNPESIDYKEPTEYKWQMTAVLEKDFEVPMGHLRQSDKFNWGVGITNSYDMTEGIHVYMYIYRQVCDNGLYAWTIGGRKNFIHVEKEQNHEAILEKITNGIVTIVEEHGSFFTRLDEMSKVAPTEEQVKLLLKRIGLRKYEAQLLADRGVSVEFDHKEIKEVILDTSVDSEYSLLNAITNMSKETNTTSRQLELQRGLMEKILQARTIVPTL